MASHLWNSLCPCGDSSGNPPHFKCRAFNWDIWMWFYIIYILWFFIYIYSGFMCYDREPSCDKLTVRNTIFKNKYIAFCIHWLCCSLFAAIFNAKRMGGCLFKDTLQNHNCLTICCRFSRTNVSSCSMQSGRQHTLWGFMLTHVCLYACAKEAWDIPLSLYPAGDPRKRADWTLRKSSSSTSH